MGIGASVFLLAIGAILAFAVNTTVSGIDINVIGVILMVAGALGLAHVVDRERGNGVVVVDGLGADPGAGDGGVRGARQVRGAEAGGGGT